MWLPERLADNQENPDYDYEHHCVEHEGKKVTTLDQDLTAEALSYMAYSQ